MRAVGDVGAEWLSWLTPFGWNTRVSAWSEPRWWVLLLYVALAGVLAVAAQALRARRDLGSGLFPARPGPAHGSPRLADVLGADLAGAPAGAARLDRGRAGPRHGHGRHRPRRRRPARHGVRPAADREHRRHRRARGLAAGGRAVDLGRRHHLLRDRRGRPRERGRARRAHRTGARHRHLPQPVPAGRAAGRPRRGGLAAPGHRAGHRHRPRARHRRPGRGGPRPAARRVARGGPGGAAVRRPQRLVGRRLGAARAVPRPRPDRLAARAARAG